MHLTRAQPTCALPEVPADPEHDHDRKSKIRLEEVFSGADLSVLAEGVECGVELNVVSD
jgi:hypothetical protein